MRTFPPGSEKKPHILFALLLVLLFLPACGDKKEEKKVDGPGNPSADTVVIPETMTPPPAVVVKAHPVTSETRETYQWYCAQCHGIKGKGNGINAPHTAVPPRDHTKPAYLETRSDEQLFHVIKFGGLAGGRAPCMPRWGHTLDDNTIHSLVNYIRELCDCEYQ